jgi:hypothetical protein
MKGLSETNLRHMRAFAQAWPDWEVCPQACLTNAIGAIGGLAHALASSEHRSAIYVP